MDGDTFRNHIVKFRNKSRRVVEKINDYTADNVHIADANDYEKELLRARNAFEQVQDDLDKVIDELDPGSDAERIEQLENMLSELTEAVDKNENEVKDKMAEIIQQDAAAKLRIENDVMKKHAVLRMQIRIESLKKKANKVKSSSLRLYCKQVSKMVYLEIHANLLECEDLEEKAEELCKSVEDLEVDSIGLDIDSMEIMKMKKVVEESLNLLEKKIRSFKRRLWPNIFGDDCEVLSVLLCLAI